MQAQKSLAKQLIKKLTRHSHRLLSKIIIYISVFLSLLFLPYHTTFSLEANKADINTIVTNPDKTLGISQIVEHPALDAVRLGLLQSLNEQGFIEGKNLKVTYENAQGNIATSSQIAIKLLSLSNDVSVGISTASAQTLFHAAQKQKLRLPIVYSAVTDPLAAKLTPGSTNYPITGVTDAPNLEGLMEVIDALMPKLKTLGLLYNPAEVNSVSTIKKLKPLLKAKGIHAVEVTVNKTSDVPQAVQSFIGKVDALYFPQDNTVVAAIDSVANIASQSSPSLAVILPIFSSDPALMEKGILAAVGYDYKDLGKQTGELIGRIFKGENPSDIPSESPKHLRTAINQGLAHKLGLSIPAKLKLSEIELIGSP